jgi:Flp pilus assembly protein TadG
MRLNIAALTASAGREFLGTAGAAAVEFALVTPFLVALTFGGVDFGTLFKTSQTIAAATRVGAEFARSSPTCQAGIQVLNTPQVSAACATGIKNAMQNAGNFTPALTFPTAPVLACYCDSDNSTITCGNNPCTTINKGNNEVFIRVTARQAITSLIPWPGFPATLNGLSELRLQ